MCHNTFTFTYKPTKNISTQLTLHRKISKSTRTHDFPAFPCNILMTISTFPAARAKKSLYRFRLIFWSSVAHTLPAFIGQLSGRPNSWMMFFNWGMLLFRTPSQTSRSILWNSIPFNFTMRRAWKSIYKETRINIEEVELHFVIAVGL